MPRKPVRLRIWKDDMRRNRLDRLIPFEESRRIIRLERRGRNRNSAIGGVFGILGAACLLYCVGIAIAGFGTYFFLIWGCMGIACVSLWALLRSERCMDAIPGWAKGACCGAFGLGLLLFGTVEGMILSRYGAEAGPGADYLIVLGAQWKASGPSEVLRRRLDEAVAYLERNPDTKAIVSGGQGGNENISEAQGMRGYLIQAGIDEGRILVEDRSANTYENLVFSAELLDREKDRVVVVTNNFHMFRALAIARKQGYANVEGLAASSVPGMAPNNLLREFFGVAKDFLVGNLTLVPGP